MGVLISCPVDDETAVEDGQLAAPAAWTNAVQQTVLKASLAPAASCRLSFKMRGEQQQSLQVETKIFVTSLRAAPAPMPMMPRDLCGVQVGEVSAAPNAVGPGPSLGTRRGINRVDLVKT
ncbi:Os06g0206800 [Oryza sativa Japonica Group]|uniref:Os06g0206800 protein n=1 Tax=Oryza sativa subsp. japonica TaxID=39947 RepID=A0A0P0WTU2_ORYSJ|nr:Os06g0206800 [Oryza sativa Japonica Group]